MLARASIALADRCDHLTMVARTQGSLSQIEASLAELRCTHYSLQLDWSNQSTFLKALKSHMKRVGSPDLVLAWLHDDAFGPKIAETISEHRQKCQFFQVKGSAAGAPGNTNLNAVNISQHILYHEIILGFHLEEDQSRWLSNTEISDGVLTAMDNKSPVSIVGTISPWSRRP